MEFCTKNQILYEKKINYQIYSLKYKLANTLVLSAQLLLERHKDFSPPINDTERGYHTAHCHP